MPARHPFTYHRNLWVEALSRLPQIEAQARQEAVEHVRDRVHAAARSQDLSTASVGVYWDEGQPQLHIGPGETADREYGTLETPPQAALRNVARRSTPEAAGLYQRRVWMGLGIG